MLNFKSKSKNYFEPYFTVLPLLKDIIQEDVMLSITDTENFLAYYPGDKMRIELKVGSKIPNGDPLLATIAKNEIISAIVPKEVYGLPFKAVTYPLRDSNNKCIGAIGFAKSLERDFLISDSLKTLLQVVSSSTSDMDTISSNINEISSKTEDNSSAIEESLASIQEMSSDTQLMDEAIKETKAITNEVKKAAEDGTKEISNIVESVNAISESTSNVVNLINALNDSTQKIGDIVNLINAISDQTNLLALNAAIEAARAGEQGRGFAVVADEVRNLAEQSKNATVDISNLVSSIQRETVDVINAVKDSKDKVALGVTSSQITSDKIMEILDSITNVHEKIDEISNKADIQAERSTQMAVAIESIAHSVNETSASTQSISTVAENERDNFKLLESNLKEVIEKLTKL